MDEKKYAVGDKVTVNQANITLEIHKNGCSLRNNLRAVKGSAVVTGVTDDGVVLIIVDDRGLIENTPLNTPQRGRAGDILIASGYFTGGYHFKDLVHGLLEEGEKEIARRRRDLDELEKEFASLKENVRQWVSAEAVDIRRRAANLLNRRSDKTL